jgi:beta-mannanase
MFKKSIIGMSLVMSTTHGFCTQVNQPSFLPEPVKLGVYDIPRTFETIRTVSFEKTWVHWDMYNETRNNHRGSTPLLAQLKAMVAKGRTSLIAIEPWPVASIGTADSLLPDIAAGKYDLLIKAIARDVNALGAKSYIRWGPEMEFVHEYPWARKLPSDYVAAYRHFVTVFKEGAPKSVMIWSPVGNDGLQQYYPGADVVDYVGFSLFEVPAASTTWFGHPMSFDQWMQNKYPRLAQFNKPIIIAELGVADVPEKQKQWLLDAFGAIAKYLLLQGMVYFNAQDSHSWEKWGAKGAPNWTIDPAIFK